MNICLHCGSTTNNPKFCNSSCAASFNNKLHPRRTRSICYCKYCGTEVLYRRTVCDVCNKNVVDWSTITYENICDKRNYQKNSRIRTLARKIYNDSDQPKACKICGYDKHYHVCHIKDINKFTGDTLISEINDINNLVALCPNHHWEFDSNLITL